MISPTPVLKPDITTYFFPSLDVDTTNMVNASEVETPDQRYWLVTVIVANASQANDTMEPTKLTLQSSAAAVVGKRVRRKIDFTFSIEANTIVGFKIFEKNICVEAKRLA